MAGEGEAVVVHRGRRYRRAPGRAGRDGIAERRVIGLAGRIIHSGSAVSLPQPPHPHMSKGILSAELICPSTSTSRSEAHPFQRYKPLPAIGSTATCPEGDHAGRDPPTQSVTVCVRLPDGGRTLVTLPLSSPLSCLVAAALKDAGTVHVDHGIVGRADGWVLCTSEVPKKELSNLSLSLQDAGLSLPCTLHLVPPSPPSPRSP